MALQTIKKQNKEILPEASERLEEIPSDIRKMRNERTFMSKMLELSKDLKGEEINKESEIWTDCPLMAVEICGTEGTGKTHSAMTFPNPAILDTEGKAKNVMVKFGYGKLFKADSFLDVIDFVGTVIRDDTIKTAVFDSSRDVVDMAEQFTLEQLERTALFSQAGAVMYTHINQKMDWIVQVLRANKKNIVFTTRMKEEYIGNQRTGNLIRDGYKKAPYQFDIVVELTTKLEWNGNVAILTEPIAKVVKNGFVRRGQSKPYLIDATYETLVKEIREPVDIDTYMNEFIKKNGFKFVNERM